MSFAKWNRVLHRWGAMLIALPLLVVICTGLLLQVKKQFTWIQPPTKRGDLAGVSLSFEHILEIAKTVPQAGIAGWGDVDRLDVRPSKGMLKVRAKNQWEIQLDSTTGDLLQVAYRRSDFIESLHDGSFFHDNVKLWVFLPSALILLGLWVSGIYLFILPYYARWRRRCREALNPKPSSNGHI
jgi:uncharacterized iron-regulated membrane protein